MQDFDRFESNWGREGKEKKKKNEVHDTEKKKRVISQVVDPDKNIKKFNDEFIPLPHVYRHDTNPSIPDSGKP